MVVQVLALRATAGLVTSVGGRACCATVKQALLDRFAPERRRALLL